MVGDRIAIGQSYASPILQQEGSFHGAFLSCGLVQDLGQLLTTVDSISGNLGHFPNVLIQLASCSKLESLFELSTCH